MCTSKTEREREREIEIKIERQRERESEGKTAALHDKDIPTSVHLGRTSTACSDCGKAIQRCHTLH